MGSGTDQGKDGRLPLGRACAGGTLRVRRVDPGQSPPAHDVCRSARRQARARRDARVHFLTGMSAYVSTTTLTTATATTVFNDRDWTAARDRRAHIHACACHVSRVRAVRNVIE